MTRRLFPLASLFLLLSASLTASAEWNAPANFALDSPNDQGTPSNVADSGQRDAELASLVASARALHVEPAGAEPFFLQYASFRDVPGDAFFDAVGARVRVRFDVLPGLTIQVPPTLGAYLASHDPRVVYSMADEKFTYDLQTAVISSRAIKVWGGAEPIQVDGQVIDGSGVTVAVVDSGANGLHPDTWDARLVIPGVTPPGKLLACVNLAAVATLPPNASLPDCDQDVGHGTHVAGIAAGNGWAAKNGLTPLMDGVPMGVAPGANLFVTGLGYEVEPGLSPVGGGSILLGLEGLNYVLRHAEEFGIRVVNNSWSTAAQCASDFPGVVAAYRAVEDALVDEGVVVVWAASNSGGAGTYGTNPLGRNPTPGVIMVANYDDEGSGTRDGHINPSSSEGCVNTQGAQGDLLWTWPDVSAPGTDIVATSAYTAKYSTALGAEETISEEIPVPPGIFTCQGDPNWQGALCGYEDGQQPFYVTKTGTSMAAPHVAGIVALMAQANPALTPGQMEAILIETATPWGAGDEGTYRGRGHMWGGNLDPDAGFTNPSSCYVNESNFGSFAQSSQLDASLYICRDFKRGRGLVDAEAAVERAIEYDGSPPSNELKVTTPASGPVAAGSLPIAGSVFRTELPSTALSLYVHGSTQESPAGTHGQVSDGLVDRADKPLTSDAPTPKASPAVYASHTAADGDLVTSPATLPPRTEFRSAATLTADLVVGDGSAATQDSIVANVCLGETTQTAFVPRVLLRLFDGNTMVAERLSNQLPIPYNVPSCVGYPLEIGRSIDEQTPANDAVVPIARTAQGDYRFQAGDVLRLTVNVDTALGGPAWELLYDHPDYPTGLQIPRSPTTLNPERIEVRLDGQVAATVALAASSAGLEAWSANIDAGSIAGSRTLQVRWLNRDGGQIQDVVRALEVQPADSQAPSAVGNLRMTSRTTTTVSLAWDAATDNTGVTGYLVQRDVDGTFTTLQTATGLLFTDSGLDQGTTYTYRVMARDAVGNVGPATDLAVETLSASAPSQVGGLSVTQRTSQAITLGWTAASDADGDLQDYRVERLQGASWQPAGIVTGLSFTAAGLVPDTEYSFRVRARDAGGLEGSNSAVVGRTLPDTTPPTAVGGLLATPATDTIQLTWTAATDLGGGSVAAYEVRRGPPGGPYALLGSTAMSPFTDSGLDEATAYGYTVHAIDSFGNAGPASTASATTLSEAKGAFVAIETPLPGGTLQGSTATVTGTAGRAPVSQLDSNGDGFVVIAVVDTGINPYHADFGAAGYPRNTDSDPDNDVDFTKHPSTYLDGIPDATSSIWGSNGGRLPLACTAAPLACGSDFVGTQANKLYWFPGTKIIGALDNDGDTDATEALPDDVRLLDQNGHGTGSASVAVGNLYGSCPECLLVAIEGFDPTWAFSQPWIDFVSNSYGSAGNLLFPPDFGTGLFAFAGAKAAAERGQTILYAAGNGVENGFIVPHGTWTGDQTGPDWHVVVGAVYKYADGSTDSVLGSGKPVDISSYGTGDGNAIPAACHDARTGDCGHSGTSAATPITAGHFGSILTTARAALGDTGRVGTDRVDSTGVVAQGTPVAGSPYLEDGRFTRAELWSLMFHTASPLNPALPANPIPPATAGDTPADFFLTGYGVSDDSAEDLARAVLFGEGALLDKAEVDRWMPVDKEIRDTLWGTWDDDAETAPPTTQETIGLARLGFTAQQAALDVETFQNIYQTAFPPLPAGDEDVRSASASGPSAPCDGPLDARLELFLDGETQPRSTLALPTDTGSCTTPWSLAIDVDDLGTSSHTLRARYRDGQGNNAEVALPVQVLLRQGSEAAGNVFTGSFAPGAGPADDAIFSQTPDEQVRPAEPGPEAVLYHFTVPEGARTLAFELSWDDPNMASPCGPIPGGAPAPVRNQCRNVVEPEVTALPRNDLDLYLVDPSGVLIDSGTVSGAEPERFSMEMPSAGQWTAWVSPYLVLGKGQAQDLPFALEVALTADDLPEEMDGATNVLFDNCPRVANPNQSDSDGDGVGDACQVGRWLQPVVLLGAQLPGLSVVPNYVERAPPPGCGPQVPQVGGEAPAQCQETLPPQEERQDGFYVPAGLAPGQAAGAPVGQVAAWSYGAGGFTPIRVQVDERFGRYLTNYDSEFATYSQSDFELTYAFDVEGRMKETRGEGAKACSAPGDDMTAALCDPTKAALPDPVAGLDHDDEVVFMFRDAGSQAPAGVRPSGARGVVELRVVDPLDPQTVRYAYVGLADEPTIFEPIVAYERDADADQFVQANRGGYGGAQGGGPCWKTDGEDPEVDGEVGDEPLADCDGRRPRDSATVTGESYQFHYAGRWKMDEIRLRDGDGWGPDLVDRWKGRAFQLRDDVGYGQSIAFEDETYWAKSSITMGERAGPVRVLRETWGADSATHITRLETFYAGHFEQLYHLRVHPIPPDGIYAFWDHNEGAVDTYYSSVTAATAPNGVAIDGQNDELLTCSDGDARDDVPQEAGGQFIADASCPGDNGLFLIDVPDPTVQLPLSNLVWDQVAGDSGSMATTIEAIKTAPAGVLTTYYRDDARFDDGTGHDPSDRLQKNGCDPGAETCQGSFGAHGVHFFFTGDTDNAFAPAPTDEFVARTAQYLLPGEQANVGEAVASIDRVPLVAVPVCDAGCAPSGAPADGFVATIQPRNAQTAQALTIMEPDLRNTYVFAVQTHKADGTPYNFEDWRLEIWSANPNRLEQAEPHRLVAIGSYGEGRVDAPRNDGDDALSISVPAHYVFRTEPQDRVVLVRLWVQGADGDMVATYSEMGNALINEGASDVADAIDPEAATPIRLEARRGSPIPAGTLPDPV